MSVNGQVYDTANRHTGFHKHFICKLKETLSHHDSPTGDQDIRRIKYTRGANFTKLCRRHRETSTTIHNERFFVASATFLGKIAATEEKSL